jgi:hypothetical protein
MSSDYFLFKKEVERTDTAIFPDVPNPLTNANIFHTPTIDNPLSEQLATIHANDPDKRQPREITSDEELLSEITSNNKKRTASDGKHESFSNENAKEKPVPDGHEKGNGWAVPVSNTGQKGIPYKIRLTL